MSPFPKTGFMLSRRLIYNLAIVTAALASVAVATIWFMRTSSFEYDVRQNYQYHFQDTEAKISAIKITDGVLKLPRYGDYENQSTFLEINLKSTLWGRFVRPLMELNSSQSSLNHYFEHGVRGIRYINISQLLSDGIEYIELKGKHIHMADGNIQLISFHNDPLDGKRILIISPHPDDAEIAAFGLYSTYKDSYIVTITAGDAGEYRYDELFRDTAEHYMEKGRLRTWNSLTVPMLSGLHPERLINLGFFDGTLMQMAVDEHAIVPGIFTGETNINIFRKQNVSALADGLNGVSNWKSLIDNMAYLLAEINPDIIVTPLPAIDYNSDHKYSSIAVIQAIKRTGKLDGKFYFYTNGSDISRFYPRGKTGSIISLPPNFGRKLHFNTIYSHSLTPDMQKRKLLALDAMNDQRQDTEWRFYDVELKRAVRTLGKELLHRDEGYFRRSVRSNELFFVVEIKDIFDDRKLKLIQGEL